MKVLIVDDDGVLAQILRHRLESEGAQTVVASDAMQAIMFAQKEAPDGVLLDINMPGGNGLEVLKRIRASVRTRHVPVIVISANQDPGLPARVKALGADEFVAKPADLEQILTLLADLVEQRRLAASIAKPVSPGRFSH